MKASMTKFQLFSLTFHFLSRQERDLHCSHRIMLRINKRTLTEITVLYKTILIYTHHHKNHTTVFSLLTRNTYHHSFLTLHIAIKILTSTASSSTTTQLPKCIYSDPSRRPSMMKNQDPSLSRMNSYNLSKYPY